MRIPQKLHSWLRERAINFIYWNKPNEIVQDSNFNSSGIPYLSRWYVLRAKYFMNIFFHRFHRSDDDRALHDHPWFNMSILLVGSYREHTKKGVFLRQPGYCYVRAPWTAHRVELLRDAQGNEIPVTTLFITGPKIRAWGFLCPQGWRHWREYHSSDGPGTPDRGCA